MPEDLASYSDEELLALDIPSIKLTEDEKILALKEALHKKKGRLRNLQYQAQLRKGRQEKKFTSDEYWQRYQDLGKEKFKDKFHLTDEESKIIDALCYYFARESKFEKIRPGYSLRKGLCLFGPVGCRKTTIMRFFQLNQVASYRVVGVRDIVEEYMDKDNSVKTIKKYTGYSELGAESHSLFNQRFGGWCFDDLGTEDIKINYGNVANVMQHILLNRYDSQQPLYNTHITTNAGADQIKDLYGERLASRMREMFNIIEFPQTAKDTRG